MTRALVARLGLCALWLLAIGMGFAMALVYEGTSGKAGPIPGHWPAGATVALDSSRDTLILFAHPQCPCTRASIEELNRLLSHCNGRIAAHVLFLAPTSTAESWVQSGLWRDASAIPGVTVDKDPAGRTAQEFGAETSGFVVLYDPAGRLLFQGGITASRGHAGDNAGEDTILALVSGAKPALTHTPVYGCSLLDESCSQPR